MCVKDKDPRGRRHLQEGAQKEGVPQDNTGKIYRESGMMKFSQGGGLRIIFLCVQVWKKRKHKEEPWEDAVHPTIPEIIAALQKAKHMYSSKSTWLTFKGSQNPFLQGRSVPSGGRPVRYEYNPFQSGGWGRWQTSFSWRSVCARLGEAADVSCRYFPEHWRAITPAYRAGLWEELDQTENSSWNHHKRPASLWAPCPRPLSGGWSFPSSRNCLKPICWQDLPPGTVCPMIWALVSLLGRSEI